MMTLRVLVGLTWCLLVVSATNSTNNSPTTNAGGNIAVDNMYGPTYAGDTAGSRQGIDEDNNNNNDNNNDNDSENNFSVDGSNNTVVFQVENFDVNFNFDLNDNNNEVNLNTTCDATSDSEPGTGTGTGEAPSRRKTSYSRRRTARDDLNTTLENAPTSNFGGNIGYGNQYAPFFQGDTAGNRQDIDNDNNNNNDNNNDNNNINALVVTGDNNQVTYSVRNVDFNFNININYNQNPLPDMNADGSFTTSKTAQAMKDARDSLLQTIENIIVAAIQNSCLTCGQPESKR